MISSCWPSTHFITVLVTIRYNIKGLPSIQGTSRGDSVSTA
jgi:hypothetical protein